jgi:hypothetical protein
LIHRKFKVESDSNTKIPFKNYFLFLAASIIAVFIWGYLGASSHGEIILDILVAALIVEPAVAVLTLIGLGFKVFLMDQSSKYSQNSRILNLKRQFWLIFGILGVVSTVFVTEILAFIYLSYIYQSNDLMIVLDVIKCYSAGLILALAMDCKVIDIASV